MSVRVYVAVAVVSMAAALASTSTAAAAQSNPPSTRPSTAPAGQAADVQSVKDALKQLAVALQQGDRAAIGEVLHAATPDERKMLGAMADMAAALANLHRSAVDAFGAEGAHDLTGDAGDSADEEVARIESARVDVKGEEASVQFPEDEGPSYTLRRVDGRWRVPMAELCRDIAAEELEQRFADLAAQTQLISELSAEVTAGKYKSAANAAEAWNSKIMQAVTPKRATSGPTNGATTRKTEK